MAAEPPNGSIQTFPANNAQQTAIVTIATPDVANIDFGIRPLVQDLKVELVNSTTATPGLDMTYTLRVTNMGEIAMGGMLSIEHDAKLDFVNGVPANFVILTGGLIRWTVELLQPNASKDYSLTFYVNIDETNGTILSSLVRVDPLLGDATEADNQFTLRDTVEGGSARFPTANQLPGRIYPNPAKERVFVETQLVAPASGKLLLINYSGQTVYENQYELNAGLNQLSVELPSLPAGLYLLELKTPAGSLRSPVVIRNE